MLQMFHGPTSKTSPFCIGRKLKNNSVKGIIDNKLFSKLISVAFCSSISLNMTKKFQEVPKAVIAMTFYFVFCFLRLLYYLGSDIIFQQSFLLVWCRKMMQHFSSIAAGDMKLISVDQKQREVLFSHQNFCLNFDSCLTPAPKVLLLHKVLVYNSHSGDLSYLI